MPDDMRNKIERFVEIIGRRWKTRRYHRIADCQTVASFGNRRTGNGKYLEIILLLHVGFEFRCYNHVLTAKYNRTPSLPYRQSQPTKSLMVVKETPGIVSQQTRCRKQGHYRFNRRSMTTKIPGSMAIPNAQRLLLILDWCKLLLKHVLDTLSNTSCEHALA